MIVEVYDETECVKSEEFKTASYAHSYACFCINQLLKKGFKIVRDDHEFGQYAHLCHPKSMKNTYVVVKEGVSS